MRFRILVAMRVDNRTFCSAMKMRETSHFLTSYRSTRSDGVASWNSIIHTCNYYCMWERERLCKPRNMVPFSMAGTNVSVEIDDSIFRLYVTLNHYLSIALLYSHSGPGSVDGIATGYGLDSPGIESRWGRDFPYLSRPALGPTQTPVQWVTGLSRG